MDTPPTAVAAERPPCRLLACLSGEVYEHEVVDAIGLAGLNWLKARGLLTYPSPLLGRLVEELGDVSVGISSSSGAGGSDAHESRAPALVVALETDGGRSPSHAMTTAAQYDSPPSVLLAPLLEHLPDLVQQEVLRRLGPMDLASLAGSGHG